VIQCSYHSYSIHMRSVCCSMRDSVRCSGRCNVYTIRTRSARIRDTLKCTWVLQYVYMCDAVCAAACSVSTRPVYVTHMPILSTCRGRVCVLKCVRSVVHVAVCVPFVLDPARIRDTLANSKRLPRRSIPQRIRRPPVACRRPWPRCN